MATLKIDGREYETENLSEEEKAQFDSLQFVEIELRKLQGMSAALQTARNAYINALKESLESTDSAAEVEVDLEDLGGSITFD